MEAKAWVMFRVLLNRYHPTNAPAIIKFLSKEDGQSFQDADVKSDDVDAALMTPKTMLARIHYSWLLPIIQTFPKVLQRLFVNALPETQAQQLRLMMDKTSPEEISPATLALPAQTFLLEKLYRATVPPTVLPMAYLPQSPFTALAYL